VILIEAGGTPQRRQTGLHAALESCCIRLKQAGDGEAATRRSDLGRRYAEGRSDVCPAFVARIDVRTCDELSVIVGLNLN